MSTPQDGDRRSRRRAVRDCRSGRHRYGSRQLLAGGIERQICTVCGTVSIDLTTPDEPESRALFSATGRGDHSR